MSSQLINKKINIQQIYKERKLIKELKNFNEEDLEKLENLEFEKKYTKKTFNCFFLKQKKVKYL